MVMQYCIRDVYLLNMWVLILKNHHYAWAYRDEQNILSPTFLGFTDYWGEKYSEPIHFLILDPWRKTQGEMMVRSHL